MEGLRNSDIAMATAVMGQIFVGKGQEYEAFCRFADYCERRNIPIPELTWEEVEEATKIYGKPMLSITLQRKGLR